MNVIAPNRRQAIAMAHKELKSRLHAKSIRNAIPHDVTATCDCGQCSAVEIRTTYHGEPVEQKVLICGNCYKYHGKFARP